MNLKVSVLTLAMSLIGSSVFAGEKFVQHVGGDIVDTVTIEKLGEERSYIARGGYSDYASDCSNIRTGTEGVDFLKTGEVTIDAIIQVGAKVFNLIKENAPLITTASVSSNALPMGVACWNQLEGWQAPRAEVYGVTYKNKWGVKVVDFKFRLIYSYGGNIQGVGQYLANATIQYKYLEVKVGYIFDASVEIPQVVNMGTREMPVAGMQLNLNWSVTTRPIAFSKQLNTASFFITGNGGPTKLY